MKANRRLTPSDHNQDVRHLVLSLPPDMQYEVGDVCCIQPQNDPKLAAEFIKFLGFDPQSVIVVS